MGYQLRMHREIRDWLIRLRDDEPELARLVGEAVLALMDAGGALGPPLVVSFESVLRQPEDPRAALDYSYQRQLEILTGVRRGIADVATSRKRLELQLDSLDQQAAKLAARREEAIRAGRSDLAAAAREREAAVQEQLVPLRRQYRLLTGEEERLTLASRRLQAKVEAFRIRKETLKASYTANEASAAVRQAIADLRAETGEPGEAPGKDAPAGSGPAPAGDAEPPADAQDGGPDAQDGSEPDAVVPPPPGTMVLRPGAPDDNRTGVLFVVAPPDTAVLLAYVTDPGRSREDDAAAARAAAERMPTGPAADAFTAYLPESFLDEFFPGAETEVEIAAGALAARSRAYTLAEARQRLRLTQAHVARRMNVRQERVSAIERAEPGATEIRTLAAYVGALGGRLEIVAHIGDERVTLR